MTLKEKMEWIGGPKSVARVKVYANGRTFRDLVIDSTTYLDKPEINGTTFKCCSFPGTIFEAPAETFSSSQLCECTDIPAIPMTCPETGDFIGYKKVFEVHKGAVDTAAIVKLLIPEGPARSSATGRKCRCQFARVLSIEGIGLARGIEFDEARSIFNPDFVYRTGQTVYSDDWDENRWEECSHGIHFFMSRQEAIDY